MKIYFPVLFFVFLLGGIQISAQNTNLKIAPDLNGVNQNNNRSGYYIPTSKQVNTKKITKKLNTEPEKKGKEEKLLPQNVCVNILENKKKEIEKPVFSKEERALLNDNLALKRGVEVLTKKKNCNDLNGQSISNVALPTIDYSNLLSDANGEYFQKDNFNNKSNNTEMFIEKFESISGIKSIVIENSVLKLYIESGLKDTEISKLYYHYFQNLN